MNTPQDGGPAFPQHVSFNPNNEAVTAGMYFAEGPGMSLRDYFAATALSHTVELLRVNGANCTTEMISKWAYQQADAMLKARVAPPALEEEV